MEGNTVTVKSYRDLEVYQQSFDLAVQVDSVSKQLPRHEMYEAGSQLRRPAKSIPTNWAEGFGRRRCKQDCIRFIVYALASCDETIVHLDMLYHTQSLPEDRYKTLHEAYHILSKRTNRFPQGIIKRHQEPYR